MSPSGGAVASVAARIGPNAITRLAQALPRHVGLRATRALFRSVGLEHHWTHPPQTMVDEADVRALHLALRREYGPVTAALAARDAGQLTAEYLLAHRIPRMVQGLLRGLPAGLAARGLLAAMQRHAWTFAGSGKVRSGMRMGHAWLAIRGNPLCRGLVLEQACCDYYAATLQTLFCRLVHPATRVIEVECEAAGGSECRFEFRWSAGR
jgi:divinyl protochlorophyllide a 8-vinyl-reductase